MKFDYLYALIDPTRSPAPDWSAMITQGNWRLRKMVALPDGRVYAAYERETL